MSEVVDFPAPPPGPFTPQIHGPFEPEYFVSINGYKVPHVTVRPLDDERVHVIIDNRFMTDEPVSRDEFNRWVGLLANAMAVAAGYSSHGEHCQPLKDIEYKTHLASLGELKD